MVRFSIVCNTVFGQEVSVVGSVPELGLWKVEDGIRLKTDANCYPTWQSGLVFLDASPVEQIEYKFLKIHRDRQTWEAISGNRMMSNTMTENEREEMISAVIENADCGIFDDALAGTTTEYRHVPLPGKLMDEFSETTSTVVRSETISSDRDSPTETSTVTPVPEAALNRSLTIESRVVTLEIEGELPEEDEDEVFLTGPPPLEPTVSSDSLGSEETAHSCSSDPRWGAVPFGVRTGSPGAAPFPCPRIPIEILLRSEERPVQNRMADAGTMMTPRSRMTPRIEAPRPKMEPSEYEMRVDHQLLRSPAFPSTGDPLTPRNVHTPYVPSCSGCAEPTCIPLTARGRPGDAPQDVAPLLTSRRHSVPARVCRVCHGPPMEAPAMIAMAPPPYSPPPPCRDVSLPSLILSTSSTPEVLDEELEPVELLKKAASGIIASMLRRFRRSLRSFILG